MERLLREQLGAGSVKLPGYENKEGVMEFVHPSQEEVEIHNTEFLARSISLWVTTKRWGLPQGKGWGSEKASVVEILNLLEGESVRFDNWEFEESRSS